MRKRFITAMFAALASIVVAAPVSANAFMSTEPVHTYPLTTDPFITIEPLANTQSPLTAAADNLSPVVAQRALDAMLCAQDTGATIDKLIVVDMSRPAREKRLWAFDMKDPRQARLILNDRVAHGSGSDPLGRGRAERFGNTLGSNMTSLGLYRIAERYQGKNGWSRKLDGLFAFFNGRARERSVVLHPSTYVGPGHVGRSQGCPAVAQDTMDALESAGLQNAILWIDGPDKNLQITVAECAAKRQQKLLVQRTLQQANAFVQDWSRLENLVIWSKPATVFVDRRVCHPTMPYQPAPACSVDEIRLGPSLWG